jgi:hypothetical protein
MMVPYDPMRSQGAFFMKKWLGMIIRGGKTAGGCMTNTWKGNKR